VAELRHSPDVAWVDSGDRVVLVRLADPGLEPVVLEGTAAELWLALAEHPTLEGLVGDVAARYEAPAEALAADVAAFVEDLRARGLLASG
jgi:hypothetical protein